jgi:chemotaxis protein CheZ
MAQAFQDLTGQIIRRVITLVEEVEQSLINMVRLSGQKVGGDTRTRVDLEGPQVPGIKSVDAVSGQDEVDDLLSSLGF